ncbi:MAG: hydroxyacid dehydrogenase, partial [Spirochaetales bacterium]|nr:hydroxyacid dehydrogenase [Spirochaetales bacterium]
IARLAKPLGARITGLRRHPADRPDYFTGGDKILPVSALPAVLPETDHLVLALPGGPETDNLISQKELSLLPSHAAVYNVGRGNAINEQDLIAALTSKTIEAAYLDVFKTEPLPPESPLRKCQNLFIMPHASAIAPNYLDLFVDEFIEKYRKKYN